MFVGLCIVRYLRIGSASVLCGNTWNTNVHSTAVCLNAGTQRRNISGY